MTFTSLIFLFVFFPLCIAGYYLLCFLEKKAGRTFGRIKDIFLILSGLAFYGWASLDGILILAVYVVLVWAMGVWIGRAEGAARNLVYHVFRRVLSGGYIPWRCGVWKPDRRGNVSYVFP